MRKAGSNRRGAVAPILEVEVFDLEKNDCI
jgi:hypothetical protein